MNRRTLLPFALLLCAIAWLVPRNCEAATAHFCCDSISSDKPESYVRLLEGTIPYDIQNHAQPRHDPVHFYENVWPSIEFERGDVFVIMPLPPEFFGADDAENLTAIGTMCFAAELQGVDCVLFSHPPYHPDFEQPQTLYDVLERTMVHYHPLGDLDTSIDDFWTDGIHLGMGGAKSVADAVRPVLVPEASWGTIEKASLATLALREALRRREQRKAVRVL